MKSSITVDLKVRGVGGSKFGIWILGRVAAFFKIKLEVVNDNIPDNITTHVFGVDEESKKRALEEIAHEQTTREKCSRA